MNYKIIIWIAIALILSFYIGINVIRHRLNIRKIASSSVVSVVLALAVFFCNIQSVDEYYQIHLEDITPESQTVFIRIDCKNALGKTERDLPENGVILPKTEYVLRDGDSVFDIFLRAVRDKKIQMEFSGDKNKSAYVRGIDYLYEFDGGELSGWMYMVNGYMANVSSSQYHPKDGDFISWEYTCNIGKDLIGGDIHEP